MKLKNGMQTVLFKSKVASPYEVYQPGDVAGFSEAEAALLLAAREPKTLKPAVEDYQPTPEELAKLIKDGLVDAPKAEAAKK